MNIGIKLISLYPEQNMISNKVKKDEQDRMFIFFLINMPYSLYF